MIINYNNIYKYAVKRQDFFGSCGSNKERIDHIDRFKENFLMVLRSLGRVCGCRKP